MHYCNAWIIRSINRLILVGIATATVMWMVFLLDMNAASMRKMKMRHKNAIHKSQSAQYPNSESEEFHNDFDDPEFQNDANDPAFHRPKRPPKPVGEVFNSDPHAAKAVKEKLDVPKPKPEIPKPKPEVPNPKPEVPKPDGPKPKAEGAKKPQQNKPKEKPAPPNPTPAKPKEQAANNSEGLLGYSDAQRARAEMAKRALAYRMENRVADASVLTQYTVKEMTSLPVLPLSPKTISSCFCVDNGQTSELKISAEDASLFGCPPRDDLQVRCMPKFFLAGFTNCGEGDLQYRLNKHHLINFGSKREPDFWTGKFTTKFNSEDNLDSYTTKQYGNATLAILKALRGGRRIPQSIIGEMAPTLQHARIGKFGEGGPPLNTIIKQVIPNAKFIFILRNPVDRTTAMYNAISNPPGTPKSPDDMDKNVVTFMKWYDACTNKKHFEPIECLYGKPNSTEKLKAPKMIVHDIINSIYYITLQEFINTFGRSNILVLKYEEYLENRLQMIQKKILPFFGIKGYTAIPYSHLLAEDRDKTVKFETEIKIHPQEMTRKTLEEFFAPYNRKLSDLLGDDKFLWN